MTSFLAQDENKFSLRKCLMVFTGISKVNLGMSVSSIIFTEISLSIEK